MKISMYGAGYVGLVSAACFAEVGHDVVCFDIDQEKISHLTQGKTSIHERGLSELLERGQAQGRLHFSSDLSRTVAHGYFHFIAVGTPTAATGAPDLSHVLAAAHGIASHLTKPAIIVTKSTVPVGTTEKVAAVIQSTLQARGITLAFHALSNPEFLKEGDAVHDFMKPDRIIIGANDPGAAEELKQLYAPFNRNRDRVMLLDIRSAELTKYAANALLALKISFMNEFSGLAEALGADIELIRKGIAEDPRIGPHFIYAGCGYGGSCFPKDIRAVLSMADELDCNADIVRAINHVNEKQKRVLVEKINRFFHGDLKNKTFAVWGLAFKPNTDDIREAPSLVMLDALFQGGAHVQVYDPAAMPAVKMHYADKAPLKLCANAYQALAGADALIVLTEWNEFRSPDFERIKQQLKQAVIFDGRNLYSPDYLNKLGFKYFAIGRGAQR